MDELIKSINNAIITATSNYNNSDSSEYYNSAKADKYYEEGELNRSKAYSLLSELKQKIDDINDEEEKDKYLKVYNELSYKADCI